jgi:hypothetical protein
MTRRRNVDDDFYSQLELRQYQLRELSFRLASRKRLPDRDREFLVLALWRIGEGQDANAVLGVNAKRGERKRLGEARRRFKIRAAIAWIAAAIRPPEQDGQGFTLSEAFKRAEINFGFTYDTLVTYWRDYPEWSTPTFTRPLWPFPE